MELIQHCFTAYTKSPDLARQNGVSATIQNVTKMLKIVRAVTEEAFIDQSGNKAKFPAIQSLSLSADGAFNPMAPADILALIFEVAVENNANPNLWNENGDGGIHGHLKTTLGTFIFGPHALTPDRSKGVHEIRFDKAKEKLSQLVVTRPPF